MGVPNWECINYLLWVPSNGSVLTIFNKGYWTTLFFYRQVFRLLLFDASGEWFMEKSHCCVVLMFEDNICKNGIHLENCWKVKGRNNTSEFWIFGKDFYLSVGKRGLFLEQLMVCLCFWLSDHALSGYLIFFVMI